MLPPADGDTWVGLTDGPLPLDVLAGLSAPVPAIPARWLYDVNGSRLFDEITRLPEYYPTRTETALLATALPEIVPNNAEPATAIFAEPPR